MIKKRKHETIKIITRAMLALVLLGAFSSWSVVPAKATNRIDIIGPAGSVSFGKSVAILPNGNIVVTDPDYDGGIGAEAGVAYLYNGASGEMISMLTGSHAGDEVGSGEIIALSNGNYVVSSPDWNNGGTADAGAVTWGSASTGVSGVVSASNSLVGSNAFDDVGHDVVPLTNGNYVVRSYLWDRGAITDAGAATWGNGSGGTTGEVSATNSLVGSQDYDLVGLGVTALTNGNYVVGSDKWDNVGITNAGAATWGNGSSGTTGSVTTSNSLVGSHAYDQVGIYIVALVNGNYVAGCIHWDNGGVSDAGAAAWGNGSGGTNGEVSASNSLVGSKNDDRVGFGITPLSSGS